MNSSNFNIENGLSIQKGEFDGRVVKFSYHIENPGQITEDGIFEGVCQSAYKDGIIVQRNRECLRKWFTVGIITSAIKIVPPEEELVWRLENE